MILRRHLGQKVSWPEALKNIFLPWYEASCIRVKSSRREVVHSNSWQYYNNYLGKIFQSNLRLLSSIILKQLFTKMKNVSPPIIKTFHLV